MTSPIRVLIAGASGYLGGHLVKALLTNHVDIRALARSKTKLVQLGLEESQIQVVQLTEASSLVGCCDDIDVVISSVGITRQKDGLSYMDVDYQANLNLLLEAERAGVKKFIYVSALNGPKYQKVRMLKAKECFATRLLESTQLEPCVIRPNGFFSDLEEFYAMAKAGKVYLFGAGEMKMNPIHGKDLAKFCIQAIDKSEREFDVGGPDILSTRDIAQYAFAAQNRPMKLALLPDWVRRLTLSIVSFLPEKWGGAPEFFLTVMAKDMLAPQYGEHHLSEHFKELFEQEA